MVAKKALENGPRLDGRHQITIFEQRGGLQCRPVAQHTATLHRSSGEDRQTARPMISPLPAVDTHRAAKLRDSDQGGGLPDLAQSLFQPPNCVVQRRETLPEHLILLGVGIPTLKTHDSDFRPIRLREKPSSRLELRNVLSGTSTPPHAVHRHTPGNHVGAKGCGQSVLQNRIVLIKIHQADDRIVARLRKNRGRPGRCVLRSAAQDQGLSRTN